MLKSLELKSSLIHSLVLLVALSSLAFIAHHVLEHHTKYTLARRLASTSAERKLALLTYIESEVNRAEELERREDLSHLLNKYFEKQLSATQFRYRAEKLLKSILRESRRYKQLSIVSLQGMILASTTERDVGKNFSYLEDMLSDTSDIDFRVDDSASLILTIPINRKNAKLGFLQVRRSIDSLASIVNGSHALGKTGEFLFGTSKKLILGSGSLINSQNAQSWWRHIQDPNIFSVDGLFQAQGLRDDVVFLRGSRVPIGNWILVLTLNKAQAYQFYNSSKHTLILCGVGIAVLGCLFNGFFSKALLSPLNAIQRVLDKIEAGFLYSRIPGMRSDQLGLITSSINKLAGSNETSIIENHELKEKIRTIENAHERSPFLGRPSSLREIRTKKKTEVGRVNLNDVILTASDSISHLFRSKNIDFELLLEQADIPLTIDKNQIQNMLVHLLQLAIESSEESSTVVLRTHIKDGRLQLLIKDWGKVDELPDPMLERYREVLSQQRGEIYVHSRQGVGNSISIEFPDQRVALKHVQH